MENEFNAEDVQLPEGDEQLEAIEQQETEQEVKEPEIPKFKVKAAGKELEVTQDELIKAYQKSVGAEERMQKAAEAEKQAAAILRLAKENPRQFLAHPAIGADVKAFVQQVLNEQLEEELLTPEQKEAKAMKAELERLRQEQQEQKRMEEELRLQQLTEHYQEELSNQIVTALEGSNLPRNEQTVSRIAQYMQIALENGLENVTAADVVPYVKRDYEQAIKALLGTADETALLSLLGDDLTSKAVKAHLNKTKTKPAVPQVPVVTKKASPQGKKSLSEWRKEMEERYGDLGATSDEADW